MKKNLFVLAVSLTVCVARALSSDLYVGSNTSGNTTNFTSGTNSYGVVYVGYTTNASSNSLGVFNTNTLLTNSSGVHVGYDGSGNSMTISNGGVVAGVFGRIGNNASSSNNSVLVTGANSLWTNSNTNGINSNSYVYVGAIGSGNSMVISNRGTVADQFGAIGWFATSSNNIVTITGTNSLWTNGNDFYAGNLGNNNSLVISNGGILVNSNGYIGWETNASNNSALVTGTNSLWTNASNLYVGNSGSSNSLTISNGGHVKNVTGYIGNEAGSLNNSALVTGSNSLWSNSSDLYVGGSGNSNSLTISNGAIVANAYGYLAGGATNAGNNSVLVTGTNSLWTNHNNFFVGLNGSSNTLVISNGGTVYNNDGELGYTATSSSNSALVTGTNSLWTNANNFVVGDSGSSNSVTISDGGHVKNVNGYIGYAVGSSNNSVLVTGTNSLWSNSSDLSVGNSGNSNSLTISNGAIVANAYGYMAAGATNAGNNSVLVTGTNSLWTNHNNFFVGLNGSSNALVISNGGTVYNNDGELGYTATSSSNSAVVTGTNSLWTNAGNLYVGNAGASNSLTISNGGKVVNNYAYVGYATNASGNVITVTGTNSLWSNSSDLNIGYQSSSNSLTISNGGQVTANNTFLGDQGSSSNNAIVVNGSNSLLSNHASLYVGYSGLGNSLTLSSGGIVTASNAIIGYGSSSSNNSALITGANSRLSISNTLTIDHSSLVTVTNGGVLSAASIVVTNGTLNTAGTNALSSTAALIIGQGTNTGTLNLATSLTAGSLNFGSNAVLGLTANSQLNVVTLANVGGGTINLNSSILSNQEQVLITYTNFSGSTNVNLTGVGGYSLVENTHNISGYVSTNAALTVSNSSTINSTLQVASFTMASNAALTIQVASPNSYGGIQASGNVYLGGTLEITPTGGTPLIYGEKLTIVTAGGSITNNLSSILVDQAGYRGRFVITGDPIGQIYLAPTSYTIVAQNQNQINVASALDTFIPATGGDELVVSTALDGLTSAQYPNAFQQISPALYTSFATMAFNNAIAQYNEMVQRLGNIRVAGVGFSQNGFNDSPIIDDNKNPKANEKDILIPSIDNHWGVFVDGNGIFANVNINNQLPGYSVQSGGVTVGGDYKWNDTFSTGIYVGYEGAQSKQSEGTSIIDNSSRFGLFGTYQQGGFFANGIVGGDSHSYQVNRGIQFPGIDRTATSTPTAGELDSLLAGGYDIKKGNFTFGPITSLQYTYFGLQPFNESGAQSLDLSVANANANSLVYSLGTHCFYTWQANKDILVVPQINLSWEHEFLQNPYALNSTLGGTDFNYMSTTPTRNSFYTGIGFTVNLVKKYDASFFYNASACNPSLVSQNFFVSLGMSF